MAPRLRLKAAELKSKNDYTKKKKEFTTDLIHHDYLPGLCRQSLIPESKTTRHTGHQKQGEQFLEVRDIAK